MPTNSGTHISIFADDSAILGIHENLQEASKLLLYRKLVEKMEY